MNFVRCRIAAAVMFCLCLGMTGGQAQQWTSQSSGSNGDIWGLHFVDANRGVAAVWVQPGAAEILHTSNGGSQWSKPWADINQGCTDAYFLDAQTAFIVGGTTNFSRVFASTNAGRDWTLQHETAESRPAWWSIDFGDALTGYVGGGGGVVAKTSNGGVSWNVLGPKVPGNSEVIDLHFLDNRTGFAVASNSANDFFTGRTLYKTTDGGQSWISMQTFFALRAVYFVSADQGFAVGSNGRPTIWRSNDGGASWAPVFAGSGASTVYLMDIDFTPENPFVGYAVGGDQWTDENGLIVRTTDGGASWQEEQSGRPYLLRGVHFPAETTGYACGSAGTMLKTIREALPLPEPTIEIAEETVDFPGLRPGDSQSGTLRISPANAAGLRVTGIEFKEGDAADRGFELTSTSIELPADLAAGSELLAEVRFTASLEGSFSATLLITSNDEATPTREVALTATVEAETLPAIDIDTEPIAFDRIETGQSQEVILEVRAANEAGLSITSVQLDPQPGSGSPFAVTPDQTLPADLAGDDVLRLTISFSPTEADNYAAELVIVSNDALVPEQRITLNGEAFTTVAVAAGKSPAELRATLAPIPAAEHVDLRLHLPQAATIHSSIVNILGKTVARRRPDTLPPGEQRIAFDVVHLAPGVYFLRIEYRGENMMLPLAIRR